ncbi:Uncharacterized protein ACO02O_01642 [Dirofilaria immitis]
MCLILFFLSLYLMKLSDWQEWSSWTECKNGGRLRFRTCLSSKTIDITAINSNIDSIDNVTIDYPSSMLCQLKQNETERQFCFESNSDKNTGQKLIGSNPFMIENEIAAINFKRRSKINPKSIKVIKIHRD